MTMYDDYDTYDDGGCLLQNIITTRSLNDILKEIEDCLFRPFKELIFKYRHQHRTWNLPEIYALYEDKMNDYMAMLYRETFHFPNAVLTAKVLGVFYRVCSGLYQLSELDAADLADYGHHFKPLAEEGLALKLEYDMCIPKEVA